MKILEFMILTIYRWYDNGSHKNIAYERALLMIVFLIWMNIFTFIIFFKLWNSFSFGIENLNHEEQLIVASSGILFFSFLLSLLIPKKKILALNKEKRDQPTDYFYLLAYIIISLCLFFIKIFHWW
jgi:hypothetical protein